MESVNSRTVKGALTAIALTVACALGAGAARAEYLVQWTVDAGTDFADFSYAMVAYQSSSGSGWLKYRDVDFRDSNQMFDAADIALGKKVYGYLGVSGSLADYSFQAQLYGDDDQLIAFNDWTLAADLKDADGLSAISELQSPSTGAWTATGFAAAVPEPTSGLLMLMGLAGLALRRKKFEGTREWK